jgi:hypothetical protein
MLSVLCFMLHSYATCLCFCSCSIYRSVETGLNDRPSFRKHSPGGRRRRCYAPTCGYEKGRAQHLAGLWYGCTTMHLVPLPCTTMSTNLLISYSTTCNFMFISAWWRGWRDSSGGLNHHRSGDGRDPGGESPGAARRDGCTWVKVERCLCTAHLSGSTGTSVQGTR